jgi:hypothetical protein
VDYYGGLGFDVWWGTDPNFTGFDPGYGYWLRVKQNTTWTYQPNKV